VVAGVSVVVSLGPTAGAAECCDVPAGDDDVPVGDDDVLDDDDPAGWALGFDEAGAAD
jgi:hypothetical protein